VSSPFAKVAARLKLGETAAAAALTEKECHELAMAAIGAAETLRRQQQGLHSLAVNAHDFLLGLRPDHGIDFSFLDALLARANAVVAAHPDAGYTHNLARHSLASARDELLGALADAKPFRAVPRP
jgi:hypothetical protein